MNDIINQFATVKERIKQELRKSIVGYSNVTDLLLSGLVSNGHCLLVGVPGLAKTLLVKALARCLDLKFRRIQFTPDLMPSDITGSEILEEDKESGKRFFKYVQGPIFANLILADEINRTPPKTQSALLEAMQEKKITVSGKDYILDPPFIVFATQNPIEQHGTYPLPEAQLDRFMLSINLAYPHEEDEIEIIKQMEQLDENRISPVLTKNDLIKLQNIIVQVPVADHVIQYSVRIVRATRPENEIFPFVKQYISWGAGPRSAQHLISIAKSYALWNGKPTPSIEDIKYVAPYVLSHRIVMNFQAEAEGISQQKIINDIISSFKEIL